MTVPVDPANPPSSTARQDRYLKKLTNQQGKRVVVDLDPQSATCLMNLMWSGYAGTQSDVIRRALQDAADRLNAEEGPPPAP